MILDPLLLPHPADFLTRLKRFAAKSEDHQSAGTITFYQKNPTDQPEVVLIQRGGFYQDWTFPKGKIDDGENPQTAALRETQEEVGLAVKLLESLASNKYSFYDDQGHTKINNEVFMFLARSTSKKFSLQTNPDKKEAHSFVQAKWVSLDEAIKLVKHQQEKEILQTVKSILVKK